MMDSGKLAAEIREQFRTGKVRLPLLPEAVIKVQRLVNDEGSGAADIAAAIGDDPVLAAAVMRLANSARFNASGREIRTLPMAVQRLGGRNTLKLLVAISSRMLVVVRDKGLREIMAQVSAHSLRVAVAARLLASLIRSADPEEAFLAGMLHDVGVQAIISAAEKALLAASREEQIEVLAMLHREMGSRLLGYWEMPDVFATVASHHGIEADDRPRDKLIDYVDAADFLIQKAGFPVLFDAIDDLAEPEQYPPVRRIGATATHLAAVEVELEDAVGEMAAAIGGEAMSA